MEKTDLRELNKMIKSFRLCHRALKKLHDVDNEFFVSFYGTYRRSGESIPIINDTELRGFLIGSLEAEMARLRKKFAAMGIDPMVVDGRKKARLKEVAK